MNDAIEILKRHFMLKTDIEDGQDVPQDNVAHFWLIYKDWPVIGATTVLSREEYEALRKIFG